MDPLTGASDGSVNDLIEGILEAWKDDGRDTNKPEPFIGGRAIALVAGDLGLGGIMLRFDSELLIFVLA